MPTSLAAMLALFNDNTSGDISAADGRAIIQALHDWIPPVEKYKMGRLAGETAHASDNFFTTYTGFTEFAPSGTVTWAASRGGLGVKYVSIAASNFAVTTIAVPAAGVPITIETSMTLMNRVAQNPAAGLVFTDGSLGTSNFAGFGMMLEGANSANQYLSLPQGTLATATSNHNANGLFTTAKKDLFLRLIWSAANTFEVAVSADGELWTDFGMTTFTRTFTPTRMGFFVGNWGGSEQQTAIFNYLRVYEADLSV